MAIPKMNFVGELQTKCQLAHVTLPDYNDESTESVFKFSCKLKDWVCHGTGSSKKFAKHNAAKQMLDQIENGNLLLDSLEENESSEKTSVSKLYEYCSKEKKEAPLYSELNKEGEYFCFKCSLSGFSAEGKGYSKKEAKERAAFKVAEHHGIHKYFDNLTKSKQRMQEISSPIQQLVILCQKTNRPTPSFEVLEVKENNVVKYKASCSVGDVKEESDFLHSKKSAKCEVANLLLQTLKSEPLDSPKKENEEDLRPTLKRKISSDSNEEPIREISKRR